MSPRESGRDVESWRRTPLLLHFYIVPRKIIGEDRDVSLICPSTCLERELFLKFRSVPEMKGVYDKRCQWEWGHVTVRLPFAELWESQYLVDMGDWKLPVRCGKYVLCACHVLCMRDIIMYEGITLFWRSAKEECSFSTEHVFFSPPPLLSLIIVWNFEFEFEVTAWCARVSAP